jgi:hypothetical protein
MRGKVRIEGWWSNTECNNDKEIDEENAAGEEGGETSPTRSTKRINVEREFMAPFIDAYSPQ